MFGAAKSKMPKKTQSEMKKARKVTVTKASPRVATCVRNKIAFDAEKILNCQPKDTQLSRQKFERFTKDTKFG